MEKFEEVKIGKTTFMKKNLDIEIFRNGEPIPHAKTNKEWKIASDKKQPAWCYYDNDPKNGKYFGKLYNWYAVTDYRGLAPEGWRIPTEKDFQKLSEGVGEDLESLLAKRQGTNNVTGSNTSGFSALLTGCRSDGNFYNITGFWSCTETDDENAYCMQLLDDEEEIVIDEILKEDGYSVRCVKQVQREGKDELKKQAMNKNRDKKMTKKSSSENEGNGTDVLFNILMLKHYFTLLDNTEEISDLFDEGLQEIYNDKDILEFSDNEMTNDILASLGVSEDLQLSTAKMEAQIEFKERLKKRDYEKSLGKYITPLDDVSDELKQKIIEFLLKMGTALDPDNSPNGQIIFQNRYLPVFIAAFTWKNISLELLEEPFNSVNMGIDHHNFLRLALKDDITDLPVNVAIVIYEKLVKEEGEEIYIASPGAASLARKIFAHSFNVTDFDMFDETSQVAQLIGPIGSCYCSEILLFFYYWNRIDLLRERCAEILNDINEAISEQCGVPLRTLILPLEHL